jgi:hypothetical protein
VESNLLRSIVKMSEAKKKSEPDGHGGENDVFRRSWEGSLMPLNISLPRG